MDYIYNKEGITYTIEKLEGIALRIGVIASILSYKHGKCIGIVICDSEKDINLSIISPDGKELSDEDIEIVNEYINDTYTFTQYNLGSIIVISVCTDYAKKLCDFIELGVRYQDSKAKLLVVNDIQLDTLSSRIKKYNEQKFS